MRGLVIGQIAREGIHHLAERGCEVSVSIASMHVGRRPRRGGAIAAPPLDEDVSPEVIEETERAVEADFVRIIRRAP